MKVSDLTGLGKAIEKFIDVVARGIGTMSKSTFTRKDVDAKAYDIVTTAKANAEALKITAGAMKEIAANIGTIEIKDGGLQITGRNSSQTVNVLNLPDLELKERTQNRLEYQDAKRTLNIEATTSVAAEQLLQDGDVSDEPVNEDWITRFFTYAQDISNIEMQQLWGKILAGEVRQPNSFSLRTLELLKNISKDEADVIVKVADFAFQLDDEFCIFRNDDKLKVFGVSYFDLVALKELGILLSAESITFEMKAKEEDGPVFLIYGDKLMHITKGGFPSHGGLPVHVFTKVGKDILKLLQPKYNFEYFTEIASYISKLKRQVKYGVIVRREGYNVETSGLIDFEFIEQEW